MIVLTDDDSPVAIADAQRLNVVAYLVKANLLPSGVARVVAGVLADSPAQLVRDRASSASA